MVKSTQLHLILSIAILLLFIYLVFNYYNSTVHHNSSLKISIGEAKARRFGLIIDGRTLKERELFGYYPNSIPISSQKLKQEVPMYISNKNTWILIYCNTGIRAAESANILYKMGYKNVRFIDKSYLSLMPGSK